MYHNIIQKSILTDRVQIVLIAPIVFKVELLEIENVACDSIYGYKKDILSLIIIYTVSSVIAIPLIYHRIIAVTKEDI